MIMDELANFYGTDKGSVIHDYCRKYEKYIKFKREDKFKIFEIGIAGGESLRMWRDYYYNSDILGIDILPECKQYKENRISIEIGDQTDDIFLYNICKKYGPFDMIIDDGSHINSDVIYTFQYLFQHIRSGGIYIVEDASTSYWPYYGGGRDNPDSIIKYFKNLVDYVNFFGEFSERTIPGEQEKIYTLYRRDKELLEQNQKRGYNHIGDQIESLNFLNSIIIITKR
jgi:hypothetical protein